MMQEGDLFQSLAVQFAVFDEGECEGIVFGGVLIADVESVLEINFNMLHYLL